MIYAYVGDALMNVETAVRPRLQDWLRKKVDGASCGQAVGKLQA